MLQALEKGIYWSTDEFFSGSLKLLTIVVIRIENREFEIYDQACIIGLLKGRLVIAFR